MNSNNKARGVLTLLLIFLTMIYVLYMCTSTATSRKVFTQSTESAQSSEVSRLGSPGNVGNSKTENFISTTPYLVSALYGSTLQHENEFIPSDIHHTNIAEKSHSDYHEKTTQKRTSSQTASTIATGDNSITSKTSLEEKTEEVSSRPLIHRNVPLQHVAFIKVHKSASSTVQNILMRYGLKNSLTFILPKTSNNHVGWPQPFDPIRHMRPLKSKTADILCYHSTFSNKIAEVMPEDTFFLTIVREPFSRLRSSYVYYGWNSCSRKTFSKIIAELPGVAKVCGLPALDGMLFDLGFPVQKYSTSLDDNINKYIEMLDKRFNLVMIVEYFDESLIILRDLLGWSNDDVLSFATNFRRNSSETTGDTEAIPGVDIQDNNSSRTLVYQKSKADFMLYLHFKRKLLKIIDANKSYIEKEKIELQKLRSKWMEYCIESLVPGGYIKDQRFKPYGNHVTGYKLTKEGLENQKCIDLAMTELPFVKRIDKYQPFGRS